MGEALKKQELLDLEIANKEALAVTKEASLALERKNWWMTALQLRVKRALQQKLDSQAQEVTLLQQQLQSKGLGDSEQIKQLTQSESELRKKLQEEMSQK